MYHRRVGRPIFRPCLSALDAEVYGHVPYGRLWRETVISGKRSRAIYGTQFRRPFGLNYAYSSCLGSGLRLVSYAGYYYWSCGGGGDPNGGVFSIHFGYFGGKFPSVSYSNLVWSCYRFPRVGQSSPKHLWGRVVTPTQAYPFSRLAARSGFTAVSKCRTETALR